MSEKNTKVYEESSVSYEHPNCPNCKNKVTNQFGYSCESCGYEFERCIFSGLALTSSLNQKKSELSHYQLYCSQCNHSGFLIGWIMRDFSQNCFICKEDHKEDNTSEISKFKLKVMIK